MNSIKKIMWQYSDDQEAVKYRQIHNLEIKHFPVLRKIVQLGWAITSFGVISAIVQNTAVRIPYTITLVIAIVTLMAAHSLLNISYTTALKSYFSKLPKSYLKFILPTLIGSLLFIADYKGATELLNSYTYKATTKNINENLYTKRVEDIRNVFSRDSQRIASQYAGLIRSKTAGNRAEIARLERKSIKPSEQAWINKLIAAEQQSIARIEGKLRERMLTEINRSEWYL